MTYLVSVYYECEFEQQLFSDYFAVEFSQTWGKIGSWP